MLCSVVHRRPRTAPSRLFFISSNLNCCSLSISASISSTVMRSWSGLGDDAADGRYGDDFVDDGCE